MAISANLLERSLQRLVAVAIALVVGFAATSQTSYASCGDYLHHGPMSSDHSPANADGLSLGELQSLWQNLLGTSHGQRGKSRCERGQCHQAPPPAPAESPRVAPVRDQSFVCKLSEQDHVRDSASWPRPVSGSLLATPFLEVQSPPPKQS